MNDETRKRLTEFLGECWHDICPYSNSQAGVADIRLPCKKCGATFGLSDLFSKGRGNRTFTTEQDLMALYRRLFEVRKWGRLLDFARTEYGCLGPIIDVNQYEEDFIAWLLCLSGEGYEERCQMVSEFL